MGTTTLGYPYPDGTDPMADIATAVQALAQAVDDKLGLLQSGTKNVNAVNVATDYSVTVTFPTAFPSIPHVVACISNKLNPASYEPPLISSVTAADFVLTVRRSAGSASVDVDWIAHKL